MERERTGLETIYTERYKACFELYLSCGGSNLSWIERRMRSLGYTDFNRRILYSRTERGVRKPGWVELYGWKELLPDWNAGVPACMSAKREHPHSITAAADAPGETPAQKRRRAGGDACVPGQDFPAWLKQVSPELTWDWKYQKYIYKYLQRVTDGTCKRLMIFMPPRHGKSELVTVRYAGWRLWNDPKMKIIVSSYNQKLADKFSRSIRKLLSEEEDKQLRSAERALQNEVPPLPLDSDGAVRKRQSPDYPRCSSNASQPEVPPFGTPRSALRIFPKTRTFNTASQWETGLGGGVKAVGVGAGVTGFGGQLIVIDDPVKSRAEAESATYRERLWDWYRNDLYTRLEPDAAVILIQTRWHQDDLAGRLLQEMNTGGDRWDVIDLPALADGIDQSAGATLPAHAGVTDTGDPLGRPVGTALCPERFDEPKLADIQRQLGSYAFSALYQQHPTPADGGIFKRSWFTKFVDRPPDGLKWKRGYDLAVSTRTNSCFTASFRVARDEANGNVYIADGFRERIEYPDQKRFVIERLTAERDTEHGIEKALHGQALIQDLRRESQIAGASLRGIDVTADKVTRALTWAPLAEEGKIVLVRGDWNRAFLDELANFPAGEHDDQIDAVSLAYSMLRSKGGKGWGF